MIPMNRDTHNDKNLPASSSFRWSLPLQALFQEGKDALQVLRLSSSNSNNKDDDGDHTADPLVDDENWARMKTLLLTYNKNKNHGLLGRHPGNNINSKQCAKILETVFDSLMKQRWQYRSSDRSNADAILTVDFPNDNVTKNMAHFWTVGIQKTWVVWSQQHRQTTRDPDDVWLEESFSGGTLGLLCSLKDPLLLLPRAATVDSILDVPEILQRAVVAPSNNTVGATRKNYSLPELPLPTAELWKFLYVHFVCTAVIRQQYPEEEEDGIAATPPLSVTDWKQRVEMCIDRQLRNSPVGKAAMALALMDWYLEKRLSISNREDKSNSEYYTDDNDAGKEGFPDDLTWAVVWEHLVGNTHNAINFLAEATDLDRYIVAAYFAELFLQIDVNISRELLNNPRSRRACYLQEITSLQQVQQHENDQKCGDITVNGLFRSHRTLYPLMVELSVTLRQQKFADASTLALKISQSDGVSLNEKKIAYRILFFGLLGEGVFLHNTDTPMRDTIDLSFAPYAAPSLAIAEFVSFVDELVTRTENHTEIPGQVKVYFKASCHQSLLRFLINKYAAIRNIPEVFAEMVPNIPQLPSSEMNKWVNDTINKKLPLPQWQNVAPVDYLQVWIRLLFRQVEKEQSGPTLHLSRALVARSSDPMEASPTHRVEKKQIRFYRPFEHNGEISQEDEEMRNAESEIDVDGEHGDVSAEEDNKERIGSSHLELNEGISPDKGEEEEENEQMGDGEAIIDIDDSDDESKVENEKITEENRDQRLFDSNIAYEEESGYEDEIRIDASDSTDEQREEIEILSSDDDNVDSDGDRNIFDDSMDEENSELDEAVDTDRNDDSNDDSASTQEDICLDDDDNDNDTEVESYGASGGRDDPGIDRNATYLKHLVDQPRFDSEDSDDGAEVLEANNHDLCDDSNDTEMDDLQGGSSHQLKQAEASRPSNDVTGRDTRGSDEDGYDAEESQDPGTEEEDENRHQYLPDTADGPKATEDHRVPILPLDTPSKIPIKASIEIDDEGYEPEDSQGHTDIDDTPKNRPFVSGYEAEDSQDLSEDDQHTEDEDDQPQPLDLQQDIVADINSHVDPQKRMRSFSEDIHADDEMTAAADADIGLESSELEDVNIATQDMAAAADAETTVEPSELEEENVPNDANIGLETSELEDVNIPTHGMAAAADADTTVEPSELMAAAADADTTVEPSELEEENVADDAVRGLESSELEYVVNATQDIVAAADVDTTVEPSELEEENVAHDADIGLESSELEGVAIDTQDVAAAADADMTVEPSEFEEENVACHFMATAGDTDNTVEISELKEGNVASHEMRAAGDTDEQLETLELKGVSDASHEMTAVSDVGDDVETVELEEVHYLLNDEKRIDHEGQMSSGVAEKSACYVSTVNLANQAECGPNVSTSVQKNLIFTGSDQRSPDDDEIRPDQNNKHNPIESEVVCLNPEIATEMTSVYQLPSNEPKNSTTRNDAKTETAELSPQATSKSSPRAPVEQQAVPEIVTRSDNAEATFSQQDEESESSDSVRSPPETNQIAYGDTHSVGSSLGWDSTGEGSLQQMNEPRHRGDDADIVVYKQSVEDSPSRREVEQICEVHSLKEEMMPQDSNRTDSDRKDEQPESNVPVTRRRSGRQEALKNQDTLKPSVPKNLNPPSPSPSVGSVVGSAKRKSPSQENERSTKRGRSTKHGNSSAGVIIASSASKAPMSTTISTRSATRKAPDRDDIAESMVEKQVVELLPAQTPSSRKPPKFPSRGDTTAARRSATNTPSVQTRSQNSNDDMLTKKRQRGAESSEKTDERPTRRGKFPQGKPPKTPNRPTRRGEANSDDSGADESNSRRSSSVKKTTVRTTRTATRLTVQEPPPVVPSVNTRVTRSRNQPPEHENGAPIRRSQREKR